MSCDILIFFNVKIIILTNKIVNDILLVSVYLRRLSCDDFAILNFLTKFKQTTKHTF